MAKQLAKYDGPAGPAVVVKEGSSSTELDRVGLQGSSDEQVQEVPTYTGDIQVSNLRCTS